MPNEYILYGTCSRNTGVTLLAEGAKESKEFDHTLVFRAIEGQWKLQKLLEWSAAGITTDEFDNILIVGGDGEFVVEVNGQFSESRIPKMPTIAGLFRLPTGLFAVGLSSAIFRYQGNMQWVSDTVGIDVDDNGFYCIAGSERITYVAGSSGCCYVRERSVWTQEALPTNSHLKGIAIDDKENVVICGWRGTLLIGKKGAWTFVDHNFPNDDFQCIKYLDGNFYLAGKNAIYRVIIGEPNRIEPIYGWELVGKGLFSDMFFQEGRGIWVLSQNGMFVKGQVDWSVLR